MEKPISENPGYVGHRVCAECHAERVAEFVGTNHARACREPTPADMPPVFTPAKGTMLTRYPDIRFEMSQVGDEFFETVIRQTASGEERTTTRIDLIYGAGDADEVYLAWHDDGGLYELPAVWIHTETCWGASHFNPYGTGDLSRPITLRCVECHNVWLAHVPGTLHEYRREGALLGVGCENCHGPGREHVQFHRTHPEAIAAHAIVHPGQLPRERQIEVCTQCHSNVMTHRGPAFAYRPGQPLAEYYRALQSSHPEDDHVANQIQYLRESKCFQQSETMTCTTCHDPHVPREAQGDPSRTCASCHNSSQCPEQPRLPDSLRADCVACHMPRNVKINVNFQTADDDYLPPIRRSQHRIGIYPAATKDVWLQWYRSQPDAASREQAERLTQELIDYWLADAERYRQEQRFIAAIASTREAVRLRPTAELREQLRKTVAVQTQLADDWAKVLFLISENRAPEALAALLSIAQITPNDAKVHGRLGTLYAMLGQRARALEHLQRSAELDRDDPYAPGMLGWLAYLDGNAEQALQHYAAAQEAEPYNAKLHYQTGLARLRLNRLDEAIASFQRALVIQPQYLEACAALTATQRQAGQPHEALAPARRCVELTGHQNLDALATLADTCVEAGELAEAVAVLNEGCALAKRAAPAQLPAWQARLAQVRSLEEASGKSE